MPWVRIDEHLPDHPKFLGVGVKGIGLFLVGLCYANRHLTDGFVPAGAVESFAGEPMHDVIAALLGAGVWTNSTGGYNVHHYNQYQPLKAQVLKKRRFLRKVGRYGGLQRAKHHAKQNAKHFRQQAAKPVPSRPVPVQSPSDSVSRRLDNSLSCLCFPVIGSSVEPGWLLSETQVVEWEALFPGLNVRGECRNALAWVQANPTRRKTARGMLRYLVGWLSRAVDHGRHGRTDQASLEQVSQAEIADAKRVRANWGQCRHEPVCESAKQCEGVIIRQWRAERAGG